MSDDCLVLARYPRSERLRVSEEAEEIPVRQTNRVSVRRADAMGDDGQLIEILSSAFPHLHRCELSHAWRPPCCPLSGAVPGAIVSLTRTDSTGRT
jgi:hypothetical protein